MSYTMYTPLNVWLDPASMTDVVAYIQTYLSENTIYSETEIETLIHDYLIAHPELIGGVQSVNGKTGTVVLSASDINTENNVTIESVLASLSSQISTIAANVATNTSNITGLTGRMTTAESDLANLKSNIVKDYVTPEMYGAKGDGTTDDTTAVQAAINSGKIVVIGEKTYLITQITLHNNTVITGYGKTSIIKSSLTNNSYAITSDLNVHDVIVRDLYILGNNTNSGLVLIGNSSTSGDSRNIISNVNIINVYNGIEIQRNHQEFIIQNCMVANAANDGFIIPTSDGKIINCTAGVCKHIGYNLRDSSVIQMTNCKDFLCGADSGSDGFGVACGTMTSISNHISQASYYSAFEVGYYCNIDALLYSCNYANDSNVDTYFIAGTGGFNQINVVIRDGYYQYADYLLEFVNANKTICNTINISLSAADISTKKPILPTTPVCNNLDGLNDNLENTLIVNGTTYAETIKSDTVSVADYATASGLYTFRTDYLTTIKKRNGIISVNLGISCGSSITSGEIIGSVSPEYKPIMNMYFPAVKLWNADNNAIVEIDAEGKIRLYGQTANGIYIICVTYFTDK